MVLANSGARCRKGSFIVDRTVENFLQQQVKANA
jgi:hypothetical protein